MKLLIRGWGYLTGIGKLNLQSKEACLIQESILEYTVRILNKKVRDI